MGKLTSSFDIIWSKYVNGPGCYYGWSLKKLKLDKAGDPYLLNYCSGKYGGTGTIIQYNAKTGNSLWSYSYKCEIGYTDFHFTKDNSLFLTGNEGANIYPGPGTSSGYHIIKKFDADKKILGETRFHEARIHGITQDNRGNLYVIGQTGRDSLAIGNDTLIKDPGPFNSTHFISKIQDIPCTPPLVNISARYFYDYRYHFCFGDTATLEATDGYTNYEWSTGETVRIIKSAESATYWVKVTEKSGPRRTRFGQQTLPISLCKEVLCTSVPL